MSYGKSQKIIVNGVRVNFGKGNDYYASFVDVRGKRQHIIPHATASDVIDIANWFTGRGTRPFGMEVVIRKTRALLKAGETIEIRDTKFGNNTVLLGGTVVGFVSDKARRHLVRFDGAIDRDAFTVQAMLDDEFQRDIEWEARGN
jgi:hypothetical protein